MEQKLKKVKQITHVWLPLGIVEWLENSEVTISDMYLVPKESIKGYFSPKQNLKLPKQIRTNCPHCGEPVDFSLLPTEINKWLNCGNGYYAGRIQCTRVECGRPVEFIVWGPNHLPSNYGTHSALWMHPHPQAKSPLEDIINILEGEAFPDSKMLKESYHSAIKMANKHYWQESVFFSGKLFEGLIHKILPEDKRGLKLAQQIRAFPEYINLAKPIFLLADSLREGRNFNDHYSEESADEEIAIAMLDLVEDLIKYLYVLPDQIKQLGKILRSKQDPKENNKKFKDDKKPISIMLSLSNIEKLKGLAQKLKTTESGVIKVLLQKDKLQKQHEPLPENLSIQLDKSQLEKLRTISQILDFTDGDSITNLLDRIRID